MANPGGEINVRLRPRPISITVERIDHVSITQVEGSPDSEIRAAAEALIMGGDDRVSDVFVRNFIAVQRPAFARLAEALGIDQNDIPWVRRVPT